jgi:hypothetical protein
MRARDLAIVGAVLVLGGFALADSLRGGPPEPEPAPTTKSTATVPVPEIGLSLEPIRNASGALVFTDLKGGDCRLHAYVVPSGRSMQPPPTTTNCQVWAPLRTSRVAYGVPTLPSEASTSFRFLDLNHPQRELGGRFESSTHTVIWADDGQRAGWCDAAAKGIDYEVGEEVLPVPGCPVAYDPEGRPAYKRNSDLLVGNQVVYSGPTTVNDAHWSEDGTLAVVLDHRRIVRLAPDGSQRTTSLEPVAQNRRLTFSPDNCAAFWGDGAVIHILDLGCFEAGDVEFSGSQAAWSADGRWIAVAQPKQILFQQLIGGDRSGTWPVSAAGLAWLR